MKKVISLFLSIVMLVGVVASVDLSAYAQTYSGPCGGNVVWSLDTDTGTLTISGAGRIANYSYYNAPWYNQRSKVKTVDIKYGVTNIGDYAFEDCSNLINITIPDSVTSIGEGVFLRCTNLTNITISNSVTSIGERAFEDCSHLTSITIPNSVTNIGDGTFLRCTCLTSITLPNSVTSIGECAFYYCTSLTNITIPNGVTSIGEEAFLRCTNLTSITMPNSVTSIGKSTFLGCTSLANVIIPDSVTSIGDSAFSSCESLTSVTIPNSVTSIGESAFYYCSSLKSITIPNSVTSIGYRAFYSFLDKIIYYGCKNEWSKINKSSINNSDVILNYKYNEYTKETYTDATPTSHGLHTLSTYCEYCNELVQVENTVIHYEVSSDIAATCTKDGLLGGTKCSVCNETLKSGVVLPKLGHSFTKYVINNDATCTKDGTKTAKCDRCDLKDTIIDDGSALGHSFTKYTESESTCTKDATKTAKCDRCGETNTIMDTGSALGHSFTKYVSNNNATCTKDGTKTAKCDRCAETNTIADTGSALCHSFTKYVSNNNATCTKDGTKTAKCDRCNVTDTVADKGSAKHKFIVSKTINATCTTQGSITYTCTVCSDSYTEVMPALGHKYKSTVVKPTYTERGYTKYTCSVCKYSYKAKYVDRLTLEFDKTYRGTTEYSVDDYKEPHYTRTYKMVLDKSGFIFINAKSSAPCYITIQDSKTSGSLCYSSFELEYNTNLAEYVYRDEEPRMFPAGTYEVIVSESDKKVAAQAEYNFKISYTSSDESFTESYLPETKYDNMKQAKEISLDKTYKGAITVNAWIRYYGDGVDFYKITVAKKQILFSILMLKHGMSGVLVKA